MSESDPRAYAYAEEIRSWLLGRIAKRRWTGSIPKHAASELAPRTLLWWIFEGKHYPWLEGPLCKSWPVVENHVHRLLSTYNPVRRLVEIPEGETDWLASAFASLTSSRPIFVSRASRPGLGDDERMALLGWCQWIRERWMEYITDVGFPYDTNEVPPRVENTVALSRIVTNVLRRWAHTAKRSRWPLLRNVVAESLRCEFELQELDKLPLPWTHDQLFELVCMVRILKALGQEPCHIRWLGEERNRVEFPGLSYAYQHHVPHAVMLGTAEFDHGLREATMRHSVRVPANTDGWLLFDTARFGFHAILIEAKSGSQSYYETVHQLKCYRAALKSIVPGRILVWGIVEQEAGEEISAALDQVKREKRARSEDDLWVFSSAEDIPRVLEAVGLLGSRDEIARGDA